MKYREDSKYLKIKCKVKKNHSNCYITSDHVKRAQHLRTVATHIPFPNINICPGFEPAILASQTHKPEGYLVVKK